MICLKINEQDIWRKIKFGYFFIFANGNRGNSTFEYRTYSQIELIDEYRIKNWIWQQNSLPTARVVEIIQQTIIRIHNYFIILLYKIELKNRE